MANTLSIKQPWASLIVSGLKDIENRTWRTHYKGRLLIHASKTWDGEEYDEYEDFNHLHLFNSKQLETMSPERKKRISDKNLPTSAIIGEVQLIDCVQNSQSIWAAKGQYHWVLDEPVFYTKYIPVRGQLKLWEFNIEKYSMAELLKGLQVV